MDQSETLSDFGNAGDPLLPVVIELTDKVNKEIACVRQQMRRLDGQPAALSQLTTDFAVNIESKRAKINAISRMDSEQMRQALEDEIVANETADQRHHRDMARAQSLEARLSIAETALFKQSELLDKLESALTECLTTWAAKETARIEVCREAKAAEKRLEQRVTQLTAKRDALQAQNDDLREQLAQSEAARTAAEGEAKRFRVDREQFVGQIDHLTSYNQRKERTIAELETDKDALLKSEKELRARLSSAEQQLHDAVTSVGELQHQLQQERQETQLKTQQLERHTTQRMEDQRRELERRYKEEARKKVEEVTRKCQAALDRAKEETDSLAAQRNDWAQKCDALEASLEQHKRRFEEQVCQHVRQNLGAFLVRIQPRAATSSGRGAQVSIQEPDRFAERFLAELRDASTSSDDSLRLFRH